jgi:4'-phosphopantetheinyl transferase EntD
LFEPIFGLDLPHGRCVGVALPEAYAASDALVSAAVAALPEDERRHAATLPAARRRSWVGGRIALRAALADLGVGTAAILSTPRGAPLLPAGARGSISHKESLAVGLAARADASAWHVGVDVERIAPGKLDISKRVLRPEELARLPPPDDPQRVEELAFAFSAKEAIYKALDPFVARYVSFQEVAVARRADGTASAALDLRDGGKAPFDVDIDWFRHDDFIITTARVCLRSPAAQREEG